MPNNKGDIVALEALQRSYTSHIIFEEPHDNMDYWERIAYLRQYSIERRMERYCVIYVWKIIEGISPNLTNNPIRVHQSDRRGKFCYTTAQQQSVCKDDVS